MERRHAGRVGRSRVHHLAQQAGTGSRTVDGASLLTQMPSLKSSRAKPATAIEAAGAADVVAAADVNAASRAARR